jgi:hypothetical protein
MWLKDQLKMYKITNLSSNALLEVKADFIKNASYWGKMRSPNGQKLSAFEIFPKNF